MQTHRNATYDTGDYHNTIDSNYFLNPMNQDKMFNAES